MVTTFNSAARLCLLLAALVSTSACVSSRAFLPAEHLTAFSPSGEHYAAEYSLTERGEPIGEVKVWSEGARRDGAGAPTVVRVGFEVKSHGPGALRLDGARVFLEEQAKPGARAGRVRAEPIEGGARVAPGESRELHAEFVLPSSVWPSDLPGYRVAWTVVGERAHSRTTPFLRAAEPRSPGYSGYWYGYRPGWYGSWGPRYRGWPPPWGYRRYHYIVP